MPRPLARLLRSYAAHSFSSSSLIQLWNSCFRSLETTEVMPSFPTSPQDRRPSRTHAGTVCCKLSRQPLSLICSSVARLRCPTAAAAAAVAVPPPPAPLPSRAAPVAQNGPLDAHTHIHAPTRAPLPLVLHQRPQLRMLRPLTRSARRDL